MVAHMWSWAVVLALCLAVAVQSFAPQGQRHGCMSGRHHVHAHPRWSSHLGASQASILEIIENLEKNVSAQAEELAKLKAHVIASDAPGAGLPAATEVHPGYAEREPGVLSSRWGAEEVQRVAAAGGVASAVGSAGTDVHPGYAQREPSVLSSRWGAEEVQRVAGSGGASLVSTSESPVASYLARSLESMGARWGAEELERVKASFAGSSGVHEEDVSVLKKENTDLEEKVLQYQQALNSQMVRSHEARLEALATARKTVQNEFSGKIATLEEKIAALEQKIAGNQANGASSPAGSPKSVAEVAYAERSADAPALQTRWGSEETSRVEAQRA